MQTSAQGSCLSQVELGIAQGIRALCPVSPRSGRRRRGEQSGIDSMSACRRRQEVSAHEVRFVPFSLEVGGAWGPAAKRFFNTCVKLAGDDRDIDLYHWSSERFSSAWINTISVLLAKGRARVSVADAATDWPKRIRDMQYLDHESTVAGA